MGKTKDRKKKKKSKRKASTSDSSSEGEVWVEKESSEKPTQDEPPEGEDWLANADKLFATVTREKPKSKEKNKPEKVSIDEMGKSSQELNPYWKQGGTGLPQQAPSCSMKAAGTVGDLGLGWLRKALERAKQTAVEDKRPLEDVVAPVWGSLDKLLNLIKVAESKVNETSNKTWNRYDKPSSSRYDRNRRDRSRDRVDRGFRRPDLDNRNNQNSPRRDNDRPNSFRKPSDFDESSRSGRSDSNRSADFRKPNYDRGSDRLDRLKNSYRDTQRSSWKKPSSESTSVSPPRQEPKETRRERLSSGSGSSPSPEREPRKDHSPQPELPIEEPPEIMTQDEMNQLAATILRAQLSGNKESVAHLKEKLDRARAFLAGGSKSKKEEDKQVILTQTDRRGFTQPYQSSSSSSSRPTSKRKTKVETHKDGKRVRYFGDDDNHSLQDLIQQEKFVSVSDSNDMYTKLVKGTGQRLDDDDFEEGGGREKTKEWAEFSRRQRAALASTKQEKSLNSCRFCMDNHGANRRLIISLMEKVYLSVPPYQSLTDGHCLIMPIQHVTSATIMDEDVWEEVMDLRKLIVKMFQEEDKDVIFYELSKNLNKFPHMVLNCVPVSKEIGDEAPIYFKKALLECETEWSHNKKVIDLKGRDVRKAVPKGLPYFAVDFGLQSGFAHVIEDDRYFPRNFAEEIIGGMMDTHHSVWRKKKKDDPQVQIEKAQDFIKKFKAFTSKKHF